MVGVNMTPKTRVLKRDRTTCSYISIHYTRRNIQYDRGHMYDHFGNYEDFHFDDEHDFF